MILDRVNAEPSSIEMVKVEDSEDLAKLTKPLLVYIDGPFGAPTSQIFRAQHAVLIGTGIGVTPFASILQSIMHRYWQARNTCPKCQYQWTSDLSASVGLNLRKVSNTWAHVKLLHMLPLLKLDDVLSKNLKNNQIPNFFY